MHEYKGEAMTALLILEASQPGRSCYRLSLGVFIPPGLVSAVLLLFRLF